MARKKPSNFLEVINGKYCQYITGDPKKNPTYCSHKAMDGSAFCEKHRKMCYRVETKS